MYIYIERERESNLFAAVSQVEQGVVGARQRGPERHGKRPHEHSD